MRLVLLLLVVLWLVQPAAAQPQCEVYLRAHFLTPSEARQKVARWRRIPFMTWVLRSVEEWTSIRLERDLLSWWQGNLQFGLVRTGAVSPLNLLYRKSQGTPEYDEVLDELRNLGAALDSYKLDRKKLPKTLAELVPEYVESLPEDTGVTYVYTAEGGLWTVRAELAADSPAARQGKPPVNSEKDGLDSETLPQLDPIGLVVAFDAYAPAEAQKVLNRLDGVLTCLEATGDGRWKVAWEDVPPLFLSVQEGWLVASDDPNLLPRALAALDLSANPRNSFQIQTLPAAAELYAFLDIQESVAHSPDLTTSSRATLAPLRSLGITSLGKGEPIPAQVELRAFLQLEESALAEFGNVTAPSPLMSRVNWDISELVVVDLAQVYRLLERAADAHPAVGVFLTTVLAEAQRTLGMELSRDLLRNGSYRLLVTYERIDIFARFLEMFGDVKDALGRRSREPLVSQVEPPAEEQPSPSPSPEATPEPILQELPMMAGLEIGPGPLQDALWKGLLEALGPRPKFYRTAGETRVETSADGRIAVARQGNLLLCAGGGSSRLIDRILATAEPTSVAALDSYRQFKEGLTGQELVLVHAKVDWLYSLVKGFLLLAGSDFRPEATALGLWRDVYGALNLESQGVRFSAVLYSTEQVPR